MQPRVEALEQALQGAMVCSQLEGYFVQWAVLSSVVDRAFMAQLSSKAIEAAAAALDVRARVLRVAGSFDTNPHLFMR